MQPKQGALATQTSRTGRNFAYIAVAILLAALVISASFIVAPALRTTQVNTTFSLVTTTSSVTMTETQTLNLTTTVHSITNISVSAIPDSPCGTTIWNSSAVTVQHWPVLTMQPNSTAYFCATYATPWKGNQTLYDLAYSADTSKTNYPPLIVGPCKTVNQTTSCSDNVVSNSFETSALPSVTAFSGNMSYYSIMYIVRALANATGFYNEGPPLLSCVAPFLAVGYSPAQINGSDFVLQDISCPYEGPGPVDQYILGFGLVYVNMTGHQQIP